MTSLNGNSDHTMFAAVLHGAKDIRLQSCPVPKLATGMVLVRTKRVGICGSDLHYFEHGCCGAFVPMQPFILGHELVGEVAALAEGLAEPRVGTRVAVNPARACGFCDYCRSGRGNLCRQTIMLGSASTRPPTDGAFADYVAGRADQCHVLPPELDDALGAMMEPFAVALHAVKRAGSVSGKGVLVTGGGPIGLLTALTARAFGGAPVVLSDLVAARRQMAKELGVDEVLDPSARNLSDQIRETLPAPVLRLFGKLLARLRLCDRLLTWCARVGRLCRLARSGLRTFLCRPTGSWCAKFNSSGPSGTATFSARRYAWRPQIALI
jgi:threonine dehydrogenase-like Zn-dependent dehydrogenase